MRNKIRVIIGLIIIIVVVCLLCTSNKETSTGNIANLGLAVKSKGVTYYNKYEKGIFAVKNGKEEQLTDETAYSLNVVENKIYYIMVADFNNIVIKSIDIDGKNLKAIATIYTSISKIYIDDGYIYYATNNSGAGIARIDLNGQNETVIVSEKVQDFQVVNGNIYYINNSNQICKFNVKDENGVILSETITAKKIQVDGKWIYYYDENENALFRLSDNGSKNELVSVLINNEIYNISGKYVYYFDKENSKIARMQIGKSNKCDDIVNVNVTKTKINIVGDELYYLDKSKDESQTYQMYRVKINGSEAKSIEY